MEAINEEGERVENVDNQPRNILEEIVWYKAGNEWLNSS